jgi:uncharacterized protein YggE
MVLSAALALALTTWLPGALAAPPAQATPTPDSVSTGDACDTGRHVSVSGAAVVNVTPNRALIQLGVTSTARTPGDVQQDNSIAVQRVLTAVRALGVPDRHIATDRYIIYPVYEDYDDFVPKGYRIDNVVAITLEEVDRASEVIAAALEVGANQVQDVQFYTSDLRTYRDQARELAMTAAREKAQALAKAGGAKIACLMEITENSWSSYYGSWWGGRQSAAWTQNVVQNAPSGEGQDAGDTPLSVGQIAVRAEINARFSMK